MHEKDNYLKTAELSTEQNCNMIDGVPNNTPIPPTPPGAGRKAAGQGKGAQRAPERPGAGTLMENRKRNVHLHVMVTPDELAAIHERMLRRAFPTPGLMYGKWL